MLLRVAQLGDYLLTKDTSHLMNNISLRIAAILIEKRLVLTDEHLVPSAILSIGNSGVEIVDIDIQKPTLEDVFLQIARNPRRA